MKSSLLLLIAATGVAGAMISEPVAAQGAYQGTYREYRYREEPYPVDRYDEEPYRDAADDYLEAADEPPAAPPAPRLGIYDRIESYYGPMNREVREKYRDGPCRVERHWEPDGDFEERISCRGPRR